MDCWRLLGEYDVSDLTDDLHACSLSNATTHVAQVTVQTSWGSFNIEILYSPLNVNEL
jgi:hypothetical protein